MSTKKTWTSGDVYSIRHVIISAFSFYVFFVCLFVVLLFYIFPKSISTLIHDHILLGTSPELLFVCCASFVCCMSCTDDVVAI